MKRNFRKPLVCMMPKSLLRQGLDIVRAGKTADFMAGRFLASASRIEEFTDRNFQLVLDDPIEPDPKRVRRVLLCSGKVFFTLAEARRKAHLADVALVRVEQLYPFPEKELQAIFAKYRGATEIAWVQDEPENRGAWRFMDNKLRKVMPENRVLTYYGREEAASPATGAYKMHLVEEEELVAHALELPPKGAPTPAPAPTSEQKTGGSSVPAVGGPPPGSTLATADKGTPVSD
jgi:2-oxoglutarate dehydrogenase E1 component